MPAKLTIGLCLLAAAVEVVLCCTSTTNLAPGDVVAALLVVAPYFVLAGMSWMQRNNPRRSWLLLAIAVAISAWGIYLFAEDSYRYHTDPDYRLVQRWAVFLVPALQWVVVGLTGLVLLILRIRSRQEHS